MVDAKPTAIAPVALTENLIYAPAIKAGKWVFLTGHEATDYVSGLAPAVLGNPGLPNHGQHRYRREGNYLIARFEELLGLAGTDLGHAVRLDQFYPTAASVDPYHHARKASFKAFIPPSTSILMSELPVAGAAIDVSLMAVMPDVAVERVQPKQVVAPGWSGFVPALVAGDFVFVAGQMANSDEWGLDPRAHVPDFAAWGGTEILKQAEFVIRERLEPALEAAGSSLRDAVKAQAYLSNPDDVPFFVELWNTIMGDSPCALSIIPATGYGIPKGIVEINIIGLKTDGATKKQYVSAEIPPEMCFGSPAVKAGDLLFLPGLMAADRHGALPSVRQGAGLAAYGVQGAAEMTGILEAASMICDAAGTHLGNTVRAQLFTTDLAQLHPALTAWNKFTPGMPLPFGAIRTPAPMPIPGCTMIADLWIWAP